MGILGDVIVRTTATTIVLHGGSVIEKDWFLRNSKLPFHGIGVGDVLSMRDDGMVVLGSRRPTAGILIASIPVGTDKTTIETILSLRGFNLEHAESIVSLESNGVVHYKQVVV